ncbi:MAG TPA: tail fiber domain-containing protein [Bdellovibrio sp.]|uniref:tail fiber domain-containing protein n=1 Tax=Bdellovibrio sp. TaxID=28201 RepID=UPI002F137C62
MRFNAILTLMFISFLSCAASAGSAVGSLFTYEGVLTDSSGNPITTSQTVTFEILYSSCVLYSETQSITPGSSGEFSVIVGAGSRTDSTNNTADLIFTASDTATCSDGSTVNPTSATGRSLHIAVNGTDLTPDVTITNVPTAIYAAKASKLGSYAATDFLLKAGLPTCTAGTYLTYNGSTLSCSAVSGATGGTVTSVTATAPLSVATSSTTPALSITQASSSSSGYLSSSDWNSFNSKLGTSLTAGQILIGNSSNIATATSLSGDATLGSSGVLTLASTGVSAGTYPKVTVDAKGRVVAGTAALTAADIPALDWSKITSGKPTTLSGYGITDSLVSNGGGTPSITTGNDTAKPTSPTTGAIYFATDTKAIYQYNGTSWLAMGSSGSGTITALTGDVTASGSGSVAATVNSVGGSTAANVHTAELAANAATNSNAASTIVKRDASGNFTAGTITANLTGAASLNVLKAGDTMSGNLTFAGNVGNIYTAGSGANTVTLEGPSSVISTSYILRLPSTQGSSNQIMINDGAGNLAWSNLSNLGVTNVSVTSPILNTGTAAAPNIGIQAASGSQPGYLTASDWTTFNTKMTASLNSGNIWVGNASNVPTPVTPAGDVAMTNAGAFTVTKILGTSIGATPTSTGQVLRYNGTTWTPNFVSMSDLRSTVTGAQALTTGCTAGQTLVWTSATDNLSCTNISISDSQISYSSKTANTFFAAPSGSAGSPTFRAIASTDLPITVYQNGGNSLGASATIGTNDNYPLTVKTAGASRMTLDASGNVGIGTTTPAAPLEVLGTASPNILNTQASDTSLGASFYGRKSRGTYASPTTVMSGDTLLGIYGLGYNGSAYATYPSASIDFTAAESFTTSANGGQINLRTTLTGGTVPAVRMIIGSSGRVGIGTTTAPTSAMLHVQSNSSSYSGSLFMANSDFALGTAGSHLAFGMGAATGSTYGLINSYTGGGTSAGNLILETNGGSVGIGTTTPAYTLHVNGTVAGTSAYTNLSDARLKMNITTIPDALTKIESIRGVTFDWNHEVHPELKLSNRQEMGVIAQEVEKTFPQAVNQEPQTGIKSVAYSMLIAPLIEAVKELSAKWSHQDQVIQSQSREIASLKEENAAVRKQLEDQRKEIDEIKKTLKDSAR